MLEGFDLKKDRSSSYLHYEGATSSVENAGVAYQSPSLIALGAGAREIALVNTFTNLLFAVLLLRTPAVVKFGESLKRFTVLFGFLSVLGWIPLILVPLLIKGVSPWVMIGLWVLNMAPNLMVAPLRDKWLSDIVPSDRLGRYLGVRSIVSASSYLSFFFLMGYLLDHFKGPGSGGFSLIFAISLGVCLVSLLFYLIIRVPVPLGESDHAELGLFSFFKEARQNDLGVFILFSAGILFSASVAGSFFSVYMLRDLHFTYLTYTLVISVEFLARIGISVFGGRWIDNAGAIKILRVASFFIPLVPVLWLFSHSLVYLLAIQVISGAAWATFDLCTQSYLCKAAPSAKRLHYIVYHRSIITLAAALGPLLGSVLLNVMVPIFGNPILGIFLISGALRLVAVVFFLPRLRDTESSHPAGGEPVPGLENQYFRTSARPEAQLYSVVKMEDGLTRVRRRKRTRPAETKVGSFYHPELWEKPAGIAPEPKVSRLRDQLPRPPEYHRKWASKANLSGAWN